MIIVFVKVESFVLNYAEINTNFKRWIRKFLVSFVFRDIIPKSNAWLYFWGFWFLDVQPRTTIIILMIIIINII